MNTRAKANIVQTSILCGTALLKRKWKLACVISFGLFLGLVGLTQAYTVVTTSNSTPPGLEQSFIAATTAQFQAVVTSNPLVSNTYSIKLLGVNPYYNAPEAPPSNLEQSLSLGATVYAYGFGAGQGYDQHVQLGIVGNFAVNCSTPIPDVPTYDPATCQAVTGAISNAIYLQSLSTPTVVGGGF